MSARDPNSILFSKYNTSQSSQLMQKPGSSVTQQAKIQPLRKGKVPLWAQQDQTKQNLEPAKNAEQTQAGLKFTGLTADASGVIIDTSHAQKTTQVLIQEQKKLADPQQKETHFVNRSSNRAQAALLKQQENLLSDGDSDDMFGDENDEVQPMIVLDQNKGSDSDEEKSQKLQSEEEVITKVQDKQAVDLSSQEDSSEEDDQVQKSEIVQAMLLKPVFVAKKDREILEPSIQEKEQALKDEEMKKMDAQLQQQKKAYTNSLVEEVIQREKEAQEKELVDANDSDANLPITESDESDQDVGEGGNMGVKAQANYEAWKVRELKRILRDREELKAFEEEQAEVERRRGLTEQEREAENAKLGTDHNTKKEKVAYGFMQKFYHKGAFFQGDDGSGLTKQQQELLNRDYNMPTGDDKMDKSVLPAVLQKRRGEFGKKGNSKWTHLADQDTTNFDPTTKVQEGIAFKFQMRQGGYKGMNQLERPSAKRKRF